MEQSIVLEVGDDEDGERLDRWLGLASELSRSQAARLVQDGAVTVDGVPARRVSQRVQAGSEVALVLPEPVAISAQPQDIPIDIVWQDEHCVVVNKAPGMVVHPAPGHPDGTLVNALLFHCRDLSGIGGAIRPGIVHRIDRDTSGLLVCAKTDVAHRSLQRQFADHSCERSYQAIAVRTSGVGLLDAGTIRTRHGRHPTDRRRFTGAAGPREAVTHYEVLARFVDGAAHVRCRLETGRTHQIRVHLSEAGAPLLGDELYGGRAVARSRLIGRTALHAESLGFAAPDGTWRRFTAAPPADFASALERLEAGQSWR